MFPEEYFPKEFFDSSSISIVYFPSMIDVSPGHYFLAPYFERQYFDEKYFPDEMTVSGDANVILFLLSNTAGEQFISGNSGEQFSNGVAL